jgi:hypothetical protein
MRLLLAYPLGFLLSLMALYLLKGGLNSILKREARGNSGDVYVGRAAVIAGIVNIAVAMLVLAMGLGLIVLAHAK